MSGKIDRAKYIELFYDKSIPTEEVAKYFGVSPITIANYRWRNGLPKRGWAGGIHPKGTLGKSPWNKGKKCPQISKELNPNWKGGRFMVEQGYIIVRVDSHPHAYRNYIREHRLVMEKKIGRYLKPTEHVHHINGNKTDNRIENLILFHTNSEHLKYHFPKGEPVAQNTLLNKS